MLIDIDGQAFLQKRRIIELRAIIADIAKALDEASTPSARRYLHESLQIFEIELAALTREGGEASKGRGSPIIMTEKSD